MIVTNADARARWSALIYGDIDLGLIDGSSVWLASTTELLARAGCAVTLLLKGKRRDGSPLFAPLATAEGVRIIDQPAETISQRRLAAALAKIRSLDASERFDLIVVRGLPIAKLLASEGFIQGRLWTYLTDIPQSVVDLNAKAITDLDTIARASGVALCQTDELRAYLESVAPAYVGRTVLLPPVVPALSTPKPQSRDQDPDRPVRLVYSGKLAPKWKTLEMTRLPIRLAERGVTAELHVIGDKIHADPGDPTYPTRMRDALNRTRNVTWHGGVSRVEAMRLAAAGEIGLSWRDVSLDASLEMSTKVLEYGSLGLPVILNRTSMHERLLGDDYPCFAESEDDVVDAIVETIADPVLRSLAIERVQVAARDHSWEQGTHRLVRTLERKFPKPIGARGIGRRLRIGVASHDLKFFTALLRHLESLPDVEVRVDLWPALDRHDPSSSRALLEWADILICEWCGPQAAWYSRRKRPGQGLIIRLHRFELDRPWPLEVAAEQVDRVVAVSESYATLIHRVTGWPSSKIVVIPNWVDDVSLDRPKLQGARFRLGFIGMAPSRKRLDRALDVLEWLRSRDRRYHLFIKTKLTWEYSWIWRRPAERAHVDLVLRRLQSSPLLRDAVVFDGFGPDVASWLRRIGFVLSTSDDESFHLAPAEGMASGSVPAILNWPGAKTIYDSHWIHESTDDMARYIGATVEEGRWDEERELARSQSQRDFSLGLVCEMWTAMIRELAESSAIRESEPATTRRA